ncbi:actin cytoskeleton and mitosis protein [Marasmius sp. AFHP31]|nr:actin cytoskeleton and mitosis protein [Marasmius sp. AFHP31]
MEASSSTSATHHHTSFKQSHRARGGGPHRPISRNKQWVAGQDTRTNASASTGAGEGRWHRGGRGRGGSSRGGSRRHSPLPPTATNSTWTNPTQGHTQEHEEGRESGHEDDEDEEIHVPEEEPVLETMEEREAFYKELLKAREVERKKAIAEGKMDDPAVPKRLEDAITIVGTCPDMCPRFERYRRERENNLFEWETIPGTKRVDHSKAVKMYERGAGDKIIPSDLRPPKVLKRTLDYLFHNLLPSNGFSPTFNFIRDRSRAVRNDFTMQHEHGALAIECHERCARFHILALHVERGRDGFSPNLEQQQLMNTLQSLKEFYEDYQNPSSTQTTSPSSRELEMRIYHRLIHIRDQVERHESIPSYITQNPAYKLTNEFRTQVQKVSTPITKVSKLKVDARAMEIFGELAGTLRESGDGTGGNRVIIYLVACLLESLFGSEAIDDIESLRDGMEDWELIDGGSGAEGVELDDGDQGHEHDEMYEDEEIEEQEEAPAAITTTTSAFNTSNPAVTTELNNSLSSFAPAPGMPSAFSGLQAAPNPFGFGSFGAPAGSGGPVFGSGGSVFGGSAFGQLAQNTANQLGGSGSGGASQPTQTQQSVFGTPHVPPQQPTPPPTTSAPLLPPETRSQAQAVPASVFGFQQTPTQDSFAASSQSTFAHTQHSRPSAPQTNGATATLTQPSTRPPPPLFADLNPQAPPFVPSGASTTAKDPASSQIPPQNNPFTSVTTTTTNANTFATNTNFFTKPFSSPSAAPFTPPQANPSAPAPPPIHTPPLFAPNKQPPPLSQDPRFSALPRIDTSPTTPTTTSTPPPQPQTQPQQPQTPNPHLQEPPPAPRHQPISLPPSTPLGAFPSNPRLDILKGSTTTPSKSGNAGGEILSPIQISSPTVSRQSSFQNFSGLSTPIVPPGGFGSRFGSGSGSLGFEAQGSPLSGKGVSKEKEKEKAVTTEKQMEKESPVPAPAPSPMGLGLNLGTAVVDAKGKGKAPPSEEAAITFERQSPVVREAFRRWRAQTKEKVAYQEAVGRSEKYRNKIRREKAREPTPGKKRPLSRSLGAGMDVDGDEEGEKRKRARKRISYGGHAPRTDEDLAKRLKENQEEHQRRWALGSFLDVLRDHVDRVAVAASIQPSTSTSIFNGFSASGSSRFLSTSTTRPSVSPKILDHWHTWLSLNPESDATAIWMEKKFGMPESGSWVSGAEGVFSISFRPTSTTPKQEGHPGLIVFECTPLDGVDDELERKYRILDDCSRLRDLIKTLPRQRYFVPALLVVWWSEGGEEGAPMPQSDLSVMLHNLVTSGTLSSTRVFSITASTKDLDSKFSEALSSLSLDTEGRLVKAMTTTGVWRAYDEKVVRGFVAEWIENCGAGGEFNWILYGRLVQTMVDVLRRIVECVAGLVERPLSDEEQFPTFDAADVDDSQSAYEAAFTWLSSVSGPASGLTEDVVADLQGHQSLGKVFPSTVFLDHLRELAQYEISLVISPDSSTSSSDTPFYVRSAALDDSLKGLEKVIRTHQATLSQVYNLTMRRRSPKRRSLSSMDPDGIDGDGRSKRPRLSASASIDSTSRSPSMSPLQNGNGRLSPSLSPGPSEMSDATATTNATTSPKVTVAMLRALTKSLKERYAVGGGSR